MNHARNLLVFCISVFAGFGLTPTFVCAKELGSAENERVLAPVAVKDTADSDTQGYVAKRSRTATKTDTTLLETPQSITVITRDQLDMRNVQNITEALRYTAGATTQ